MKRLKLQNEELSTKKIGAVVALVMVLVYCVWPASTELAGESAGELAVESAAIEEGSLASNDAGFLKPTTLSLSENPGLAGAGSRSKPNRELPSVNLSFLVSNNPFVSSANRLERSKPVSEEAKIRQPNPKLEIDFQPWIMALVKMKEPSNFKPIEAPSKASSLAQTKIESERATEESTPPYLPPAPPVLKIQAIVTGHKQAAVLINNRIYFENDVLDESWKIKSILTDRVLFSPVVLSAASQ